MSQTDWNELERAAVVRTPAHPGPSLGTLWFTMSGRIPRSTYWLKFVLPLTAIQFAAAFANLLAGSLGSRALGPISIVAWLFVIFPTIAGAVKRLHDLGHPGWYLAVIYGGILGCGVFSVVLTPTLGLLVMLPMMVLAIAGMWYSLKMAFFRGTYGPNAFGPDPLQARRIAYGP